MEKCKALDLNIFCYKGEYYKEKYGVPWSEWLYSYASDGAILVRVGRLPDIAENKLAPSMVNDERMNEFFNKSADAWFQVPDITPEKKICEDCHNSHYARDCEECGGTGLVDETLVVEIEEVFFNNKYLRMLLTLPDVKMALIDKKGVPAKFRFNGGDGLLMPMLVPDRYSDVKIITLNPIIGC